MGAYVSIIASRQLKPIAIFLMAPAVGFSTYPEIMPNPNSCLVEVVMVWKNEVVSVSRVFAWALQHKTNLHILPADHWLQS